MIGEQGKRTFPFPSFFPLLSLSGGEEKFGKNICPLGGAFKIRCSSTQSTSAPMVSLCIIFSVALVLRTDAATPMNADCAAVNVQK